MSGDPQLHLLLRNFSAQILVVGGTAIPSTDDSPLANQGCLQMQKSLDRYVGILCEARKKKGMTEQQARDSLQDMNVFGTLMVLAGDADGMVSGATSTTANTIRPALQVSHASPLCSEEELHKQSCLPCLKCVALPSGFSCLNF